MCPASSPAAIRYASPELTLGANARLVTESFKTRGAPAEDQHPKALLSWVFPPHTTTFPSRDPVEKNLELWVHAQLQIIRVWIQVLLLVEANKLYDRATEKKRKSLKK